MISKSTEKYFPVEVSINMLYQVVLTFESVDEILKYDRSNERYWAVLSCVVLFIMLYKVVLSIFVGVEKIVNTLWW